MSHSIDPEIALEPVAFADGESPFLCGFCEDIQIASDGNFDLQQELDVCNRCVGIERSLRFSDYLIIQ